MLKGLLNPKTESEKVRNLDMNIEEIIMLDSGWAEGEKEGIDELH